MEKQSHKKCITEIKWSLQNLKNRKRDNHITALKVLQNRIENRPSNCTSPKCAKMRQRD